MGGQGQLRLCLSRCSPGTAVPVPLTDGTLVHVLIARATREARGTGANGPAVHGVGVTNGIFMAWIADAGVIQVAEEACQGVGTGQKQTRPPSALTGSQRFSRQGLSPLGHGAGPSYIVLKI